MASPPIDTFELETAAGFRQPAWRQSITGLAGVIATFVVTYGAYLLLVAAVARRPNVEF